MKHTPGPWHCWSYTDVDGDPRLDGRAYVVHAFSFREPKNDFDGIELGGSGEAKANAQLMAAAPELLDALEAVIHLRELNDKFSNPGNITIETLIDLCDEKLKPLIARARGEQS